MKKLLILFLALLFILPNDVKAVTNIPVPTTPEGWVGYIFTVIFGFPGDWTFRDYMWMGLIPFLGIWLIIYGFLSVIRIFGDKQKLYIILAFLIAFSTLPLGWFAVFISYAFMTIGAWAGILFIVLFIIGSLFMSRGLLRGWRAGSIENALGVYNLALDKAVANEKKAKEEAEMLKRQSEDWERRARAGEVSTERAAIEIEKLNEQLRAAQQKVGSEETKRKKLKEQLQKMEGRMKKK